jgi:microcystin-dependent protein
MADPFVAEIRIFPFNFAPKGWAWCNGQLLPLSQNTALFSLLGTTYGGNGKSNFALPDMQGNAPMHPGQGPNLSLHDLGETSGSPNHTLLTSEMPIHNHGIATSAGDAAETNVPTNNAMTRSSLNVYTKNVTPAVSMADFMLATAGGDQPHNNMMPYITFNFNIALQGVFPPRS